MWASLSAAKRQTRGSEASGASGAAPWLLSMPQELQLGVALHLDIEDRMRLGMACREFRELSLLPQLNDSLELDFREERWTEENSTHARARHYSLRLWVQRRRTTLRRLTIFFPGEPHEQWDAVQQRLVPLVASLTTTLAGSLHSLDLRFTCWSPWSDTYLPVGGALRVLRLYDCHLPAAPEVLSTLTALVSLSISMCDGFAEAQGGLPNLQQVLGKLTSLQRLELDTVLFGSAPDTLSALTRLTALILSHNYFGGLGEVEALSPAACSALTALRLLDLSDAGLERVPPAIQYLTSLRTLLLNDNNELTEEFVPQELSALSPWPLPRLAGGTHTGASEARQWLQELDLSDDTPLPATSLARLAAATRLRRLNLSHASVNQTEELWPAVRGLQRLTYLDVCHTGVCRFPTGPWAATLQELRADGCVRTVTQHSGPSHLPHLPRLVRLSWHDNATITVWEARMLLEQALSLQTLWLEAGPTRATAPARNALAAAGVAVVPKPLAQY